ncbi:hypothetical protein LINPERHAP2_LOCUS197 [Linum perenne]
MAGRGIGNLYFGQFPVVVPLGERLPEAIDEPTPSHETLEPLLAAAQAENPDAPLVDELPNDTVEDAGVAELRGNNIPTVTAQGPQLQPLPFVPRPHAGGRGGLPPSVAARLSSNLQRQWAQDRQAGGARGNHRRDFGGPRPLLALPGPRLIPNLGSGRNPRGSGPQGLRPHVIRPLQILAPGSLISGELQGRQDSGHSVGAWAQNPSQSAASFVASGHGLGQLQGPSPRQQQQAQLASGGAQPPPDQRRSSKLGRPIGPTTVASAPTGPSHSAPAPMGQRMGSLTGLHETPQSKLLVAPGPSRRPTPSSGSVKRKLLADFDTADGPTPTKSPGPKVLALGSVVVCFCRSCPIPTSVVSFCHWSPIDLRLEAPKSDSIPQPDPTFSDQPLFSPDRRCVSSTNDDDKVSDSYFSGELLAVLIKELILFNTYSSSISEPSVRAVIEELQLSRMGDELIDIVIRHGGRMDFSGSEPKYVGGEENVVGFDTDYLSYRTLLTCAKEDLGYQTVHRMWWLPPKKTMASGLRELIGDMEILYGLMIDVKKVDDGQDVMFFEAEKEVSGGWDNEDGNMGDDEGMNSDDDDGVENPVLPPYPPFVVVSDESGESDQADVVRGKKRTIRTVYYSSGGEEVQQCSTSRLSLDANFSNPPYLSEQAVELSMSDMNLTPNSASTEYRQSSGSDHVRPNLSDEGSYDAKDYEPI